MNNEMVKCATRGEKVKLFTHLHPQLTINN
jgi:hypothetical protein